MPMKTVLATLAALGLAAGTAFAGCMGDSASHDKTDKVASLMTTIPTADQAVATDRVDTTITTGAVETENEE
jgi:hypothetical protein